VGFDPLETGLDVAILGLALVLAWTALAASGRYREPRFALVGGAVLLLGGVGLVGLYAQWTASRSTDLVGSIFPPLLVLGVELLLLASLIAPRTPPVPTTRD
jgi:hypothetical protein